GNASSDEVQQRRPLSTFQQSRPAQQPKQQQQQQKIFHSVIDPTFGHLDIATTSTAGTAVTATPVAIPSVAAVATEAAPTTAADEAADVAAASLSAAAELSPPDSQLDNYRWRCSRARVAGGASSDEALISRRGTTKSPARRFRRDDGGRRSPCRRSGLLDSAERTRAQVRQHGGCQWRRHIVRRSKTMRVAGSGGVASAPKEGAATNRKQVIQTGQKLPAALPGAGSRLQRLANDGPGSDRRRRAVWSAHMQPAGEWKAGGPKRRSSSVFLLSGEPSMSLGFLAHRRAPARTAAAARSHSSPPNLLDWKISLPYLAHPERLERRAIVRLTKLSRDRAGEANSSANVRQKRPGGQSTGGSRRNCGSCVDQQEDYDSLSAGIFHVFTSALKTFLRELIRAVIPRRYVSDPFSNHFKSSEKPSALRSLPSTNYASLRLLCEHLAKVVSQSDQSQMNSRKPGAHVRPEPGAARRCRGRPVPY
uniref:Rho-GAP domain-containing protein n=1 Tax=Macrostomum lignano TaxID=282301 RepID=A0A1I8HD82_9PLAT